MSMSSLWTDRPAGSDHDWLTPPPPPPRRRLGPPPPPEPPRERRGLRRGIVATLVALVVAAGVLVGTQIGDGGGNGRSETAAALPASAGRPPETRINQIYARVNKGVVSVQVVQGNSASSGTGFVIDGDGTIVTNAHVVSNASSAKVRFDDGDSPVNAEVVGRDPSSDLAVLHVDPAQAGTLHPLTFADSDDVRVGDTAIAIGYPLGLDRTATAGIISGLGRKIEAPNGFSIDKVIQTDAPINPGNSGGPLIDARGRVIGVNSQIATAGGGSGNVGIGFSVPSNTVRDIVPQIKAGKTIARPYLGVSTSTSPEGTGAVVRTITPGGPAEKAGLHASASPTGADGDTIVAIDGKAVQTPDDVAAEVGKHHVGDKIKVTVRRNGSQATIDVQLQRRPDSAPSTP
jgi:putative serine protease PepD